MSQSIRLFFLLVSLYFFGYSLTLLFDAWEYDNTLPDVKTLLHEKVSPEQLNRLVGESINRDELEQAQMYLSIAKEYQYPLHYSYYEKHIRERDTEERRMKRNVSHFVEGFATGAGSDTAGIAGAVAADFTVIGDARDLYDEYQKHQSGKPVNELVVGLAGVGVGLTVVTYGSVGTTATVKAGASLLKMASKARMITHGFSQVLSRSARRVFDWGSFNDALRNSNRITDVTHAAKRSFNYSAIGSLKRITTKVNNMREATSISDAMYMLRFIENNDDLLRMERFALKHKAQTRGLLTLIGKGAVRTVRVLKKTGQLIFSIVACFFSFMFMLLFLLGGNKKATA